jgi:hypothetical protein
LGKAGPPIARRPSGSAFSRRADEDTAGEEIKEPPELAPGQQAYVKIVSLSAWGSDNTAARDIDRDAFWAWLIPPQIAQAEIARDHSGI